MLEATSEVDKHDGVYFDLRGDNYAFGQGTFVQNYNGNCLSDLNGATVDNYITYVGGVITVNQIFTKAEVTTYNRVYTYTVAGAPASVIIYVTEEAAQVTITNVETSKWSTVWSTDFSSAPSGMSYSISKGACDITNGYLRYYSNDGSGDRTTTASFTDAAFSVDTDWIMELDWNCGSANTNTSSATFATDQGTAFSMEWVKSGSVVTVKDASDGSLTTALPHEGYNKGTTTSFSHFTIKGVKDDGIYLTITKAGVVYVNNVKVSSTYGYPVSFNGVAAKNVGSIFLDNIVFQTPAVAGFVATPTSTITGASGTSRKFTLSCLTDGATIYYATSNLEKGAAGWETYTDEVTTAAATIYAYAKDDEDNTSEKMNFATGAGTTINLLPATVTHSNNGVYTIASDQSTVLGKPTATIHYQIDGGSEQTSTNASVNVNIDTDGTLTYWLTADGYGATAPADETVYAAVAYAVTRTIDFKTSNTNEFAKKGEATTVTGDTHTYYLYKDQSDNLIAEDVLATSFENAIESWRIQRYYGGTSPYNNTEYIALKNLAAGQIVQFACTSAPSIVANLTAVPASTYTGTYTYSATAAGDVIVSLGKGAIITTIKFCNTYPATITSAGWATLYTQCALDFSGVTGLTAYTATCSGNTVTLTKVKNVPANTGVVLKGAANTYSIPAIASSSTEPGALEGNATAATAYNGVSGKDLYVLIKNSDNKAQFSKATSGSIPAGKAYLPITPSNARLLSVVFDDGDATGITNATAEMKAEEAIFNLAGQRVAQPANGLYIVNGKKVLVK